MQPAPPSGSGLLRLRLDLAYDGSGFAGWARQDGLRTVQGEIERALAFVVGAPAELTCAGRTDAGVHARGQVAHVDVPTDRDLDGPEVQARLNRALPADVRVLAVSAVPEAFDARFSALWRRYTYRVADGLAGVDPLQRHLVLPWGRPLDLARMNEASRALVGEHDFAAFCRAREQASSVREVIDLHWATGPDGVHTMTVRADAFCHSMVRSLVGVLLPVGDGRRDVDWPAAVLRAGVRDSAVTVMPPFPLVLEEVGYPPHDSLLERQAQTRAHRRAQEA